MTGAETAGDDTVAQLSYTEASRELDEIVEFFEQREVDVDQLVARLERATVLIEELDRRLRRTRMQVEQLVPRLAAVVADEVDLAEDEAHEDDLHGDGQAQAAPDRPATDGRASGRGAKGATPELF